jgi:tRNA threonylcarbamoyladenosine biosynthesis protein TsaE
MRFIYLSNCYLQTKKIGSEFAREILKTEDGSKTLVIGLKGDLGGGKTTFLQGFAKGLGIKEKILSPTFVILKRFRLKNFTSGRSKFDTGREFKNFYHIDCYRIHNPKEILCLGFKEIIFSPQNIVAVEWAEKIKDFLPKNTVYIELEFLNKNRRKIIFRKNKPWKKEKN